MGRILIYQTLMAGRSFTQKISPFVWLLSTSANLKVDPKYRESAPS